MGQVLNAAGNLIGRVDSSGHVMNAGGNLIGRVDSSDQVLNAGGNLIGRIDSSGHVLNAYGNLIGHVDSSGHVMDAGGNLIGRVEGENLADGAALLLLLLNLSEDKAPKVRAPVPTRGETNWFWFIIGIIIFFILSNWGGRIGAIIALAMGVLVLIVEVSSNHGSSFIPIIFVTVLFFSFSASLEPSSAKSLVS